MGKPELGDKRTCAGCAARFFDLNRDPAVCPKCSAVQPPRHRAMPANRGGSSLRWNGRGGAMHAPAPVLAAEAEAEPSAADDDDDGADPVEPADDDDDGALPDEIGAASTL